MCALRWLLAQLGYRLVRIRPPPRTVYVPDKLYVHTDAE